MDNQLLAQILLGIVPVLLAITLHEAMHAYAARHFGDDTAALLGRLSLNPLRHIDWLGTVVVPIVCLIATPFLFGWAKPVPVNVRKMRNARIGMRMVAIAGPLANLLMAVGWVIVWWLGMQLGLSERGNEALAIMCRIGWVINLYLFLFNMLPILPLDGGKFVDSFLPAKVSYHYRQLASWGMPLILLLWLTGIVQPLLLGAQAYLQTVIFGLFGLNGLF